MKLEIKNNGLHGYALADRAKFTDEELQIAIKALQKALSNNRTERIARKIKLSKKEMGETTWVK